MIRVLHVLFTLDVGDGSANVIMNLYRHINRNLIQFDFLYFKESPTSFISEIHNLGGRALYIPIRLSFGILFLKRKVSSCINEYGPYKALHLNFPLFGYWIFRAAKENGIKYLISHSHSSSYGTKTLSIIRNKILFYYTRKLSNVHFACSAIAGNFLFGTERNVKPSIIIIHNSIDCVKYEFNGAIRELVRNLLNIQDKFVIAHIGRFSKEKNQSFLIDVFNCLKERKKDSVLLLIGNGPLFRSIQNKVERLNLGESVRFLGVRNDINELLQAVDVFVLPSIFEGLPVSLVEAQAAGIPCVVSETVSNESCLVPTLYETASLEMKISQWADIILKFAGHTKQSTFQEMKVKGFDIKETSLELQNWYCSL